MPSTPSARRAPRDDSFASRLLHWFAQHGRHDLPWQHPRSDYRVWLSEIMLQQTQVRTVLPYFQRFVAALPDLPALAQAPQDHIMALWSGLGYYSRARNLHAAAKLCAQHHQGRLPRDFQALLALPGIGRSTAGAILAQAHGLRFAILDGNVKRVLTRWRGIEGWPGQSRVNAQLWSLAESLLPQTRLADYTQAQMDLGASLCTRRRPACTRCPLQADCWAHAHGKTEQIPSPKPARTLPQQQCCMLLAFDEKNRVLLQKRTGPGVWNGLWSLPQAADEDALNAFALHHLQMPAAAIALPALEHAFSHYRLRILPQRRERVKLRPRLSEGGLELRWAAASEWSDIGLPAPVRKLLLSSSSELS